MTQQRREDRRVAVFLPALLGGGAERVMVDVANGLAELGPVDLVVGEAAGPFASDVANDVRVVELGAPRTVRAVRPLSRYLRREEPVTLLTTLTRANIAAIIARKMAGVNTRVLLRQASPLTPAPADPLRVRVLNRSATAFYAHADLVIGVSEGISADLRARLGDRVRAVTIHNPVVSDELVRRAREPIDHPWPTTGPVVLGAGSLTPKKDFPTLIRAFAHLREDTGAKLVILGDGPERDRLEDLARHCGVEDDVLLPGFVANPFPAMAAASVFALSSRREGLPSVLVQAMACGSPVVSTDCPTGPDEVLEGGRFGRLVPPGDHERLAEAIRDTLRAPIDGSLLRDRAAAFSRPRAIAAYARLVWP